jgi:hypothetical protein
MLSDAFFLSNANTGFSLRSSRAHRRNRNLLSRLNHAGYLGRELARAKHAVSFSEV